MKIKCPFCGFENEKDVRVCENCEEPLPNPYIKKKKNEDQSFQSISDEETETKNKIEKEERIRAEARAKAEKEVKEKKQKEEQKKKGIGCLVLIGVVIIFYFILFGGGGGNNEKETETSLINLNVSANFNGTQFIIQNNDSFDWLNVKMEINGSLFKSGFILKTDKMEAGETYTVGALQFAKNDGTRFNPITYKPKTFEISCTTPKREDAFWSGGWE